MSKLEEIKEKRSKFEIYDCDLRGFVDWLIERVEKLEKLKAEARVFWDCVGDGDNGPPPGLNKAWYQMRSALKEAEDE